MNIELLKVGPAYAQVCAGLHNQCFEEKHAWNETAFCSLLEKNAFACIALLNKVPVGLLLIQDNIDELEILTLAVIEEARGRGVASFLLKEISQYKKPIFLEVEINNEIAISLYKKNNFQQFGIRKDYYGRGRDAVLMKKEN